jgi:hypothetical protein
MIQIEIPAVLGCASTDCAYNEGTECHAKAITVGDGVNPNCDTFLDSSSDHTASSGQPGGVGACKLSACAYNDDLECTAQSISVGNQGGKASCMTYSPG